MNNPQNTRTLGLITLISLVAGGMIGSGIFTLPSTLAQFGGISLLGWVIAAIGAWVLAHLMSELSKVIPETGGSYAYTKAAFGELAGFIVLLLWPFISEQSWLTVIFLFRVSWASFVLGSWGSFP